MVNVTINGIAIQVEEGTSILEATRIIGMPVPTLCFLKGINEIGACRAWRGGGGGRRARPAPGHRLQQHL